MKKLKFILLFGAGGATGCYDDYVQVRLQRESILSTSTTCDPLSSAKVCRSRSDGAERCAFERPGPIEVYDFDDNGYTGNPRPYCNGTSPLTAWQAMSGLFRPSGISQPSVSEGARPIRLFPPLPRED